MQGVIITAMKEIERMHEEKNREPAGSAKEIFTSGRRTRTDLLISRLTRIGNLLETRGACVVQDPIGRTHLWRLFTDRIRPWIWWYHVPSRKLVCSQEAASHLGAEFREQIPGLLVYFNKTRASGEGWISGRLGWYRKCAFVFIYTKNISGELKGQASADLLFQLSQATKVEIEYLTDENGYSLDEKNNAEAMPHSGQA